MEKTSTGTIVIISLVVAVLASIATASITGNMINVRGAYDNNRIEKVYTQAEVDEMYAALKTNKADVTEVDAQMSVVDEKIENLSKTACTSYNICEMRAIRLYNWNNRNGWGLRVLENNADNTFVITDNQQLRDRLYLDSKGDMKIISLAANSTTPGSAYVCVDHNGKLYRSWTACR